MNAQKNVNGKTNQLFHELAIGPILIPGSNITVQSVLVTPEMAKEWLERNNRQNRNFIPARVSRYSEMMASNSWLQTHQGIAFDTADVLLDGQNRLEAVKTSGVAVRMLVFRCLDPLCRTVIDTGGARKLHHSFQMFGTFTDAKAAAGAIGVLRYVIHGMKSEMIYEEALPWVDKHGTGIEWVTQNLRRAGKLSSAPLVAAFSYAWLPCSDLITEIVPAFRSGAFPSKNDPMLMLRNHVLSLDSVQAYSVRKDLWKRALCAIHMRMKGERSGRLMVADSRVDFFLKKHGDK